MDTTTASAAQIRLFLDGEEGAKFFSTPIPAGENFRIIARERTVYGGVRLRAGDEITVDGSSLELVSLNQI